MCGRFSVSLPPDEVARYFQVRGRLPNFPPRYNMAPTQDAPVVRVNTETGQPSVNCPAASSQIEALEQRRICCNQQPFTHHDAALDW